MVLQLAFILAQIVKPLPAPVLPPVPIAQPQVPQPVPQAPTTQQQPPMHPSTPVQAQAGMSLDAQAYQGTLVGVSGATAMVQFTDGSTQSFNIDSSASASLNGSLGHPIAFRVVKGAMQVAKDVKWATLTAVKDGKATLRDATNQTVTLNVDSATETQLQSSVGKSIAYTLNGNSLLIASDKAPPKQKKDEPDKP